MGHEILTLNATREFNFTWPQVNEIMNGAAAPDEVSLPVQLSDKNQAKRHALRNDPNQEQSMALNGIIGHLKYLRSQFFKDGSFRWIGEALHLIQDSYCAAHIQREESKDKNGRYLILYIRYFGVSCNDYLNIGVNKIPLCPSEGPVEHQFPVKIKFLKTLGISQMLIPIVKIDGRDCVTTGGLKILDTENEGDTLILKCSDSPLNIYSIRATEASKDYLRMINIQMSRTPADPNKNITEMRDFIYKHFSEKR